MEQQLNNLDVIFLIIAGISALVGIARGMTKEILSVVGWILAAVALLYLTPALKPVAETYIASTTLAYIVTGMVVLIVFSIVWVLTADKLASAIRSSKLSSLDRLFGFVFGLARGALIIILLALMFSTLIPAQTQKGAFAESKIYKQAENCIEPLKAMIPQSWIDEFKAKSESLGFGKSDEDKTKEKTDTENEKDENEVDDKTKGDENGEDKNPSLLKLNALEFIDNNLDVLQKNGEELFNQLAQPKTTDEAADGKGVSSDADGIVSDLDKILDVLEDVVTDEEIPETKSPTPQMQKSIRELNNAEPKVEDVSDEEVPDLEN